MTLQTLFREAINALRLNLLRSALTAFGVIIGVGGLVVMSAANSGANKLVERQIADQGTDALVARAAKVENALRRGAVVVLTDQDANAVRELVPNIQYLSREVYSKVTLVAGNSSWITEYWGVDASYEQVWGVKLSEGRFFDEAEARSGAKVIVIGATVARKLFGTASPLDQTVRLVTIPVRIIGVRRKRGSFGGVDEDNFIILPIKTARAHIPNSEMSTARQLSLIDMKVSPGANREKVKQDVLALLRERKHLRGAQEDKLDVIDLTQMVELLNTTQSTLNRLLLATAAILLLVGGVGIMNIMLVSVTERTREIGLRMAIGARRRDILRQFLAEAVTLSVVAGLIGLMIGLAGSVLVARLVDWPLIIPPLGAAAATLVSVSVGIIFGYLPARRGAGLNPIDALRRK
ncbi:ABC transporter permease [Methylocystis iwaonis]|uniref:ABC transporter permease n=1 Tax=Methylocystis iwaonis TaxID=2885079 RepID=A0ABN6V8X8_9HYPH|nr:ABC transporter permease [Methylocystis iwaonis]BDV32523.1 ABC transporter permease [Methylocystis iwaonis]